MKFVTGHVISLADVAAGALVLAVFAAMVVLAVVALRRTSESSMKGALIGGGLVLGAVVLTALLFEPSRNLGAERRAVDTRMAELAARAIVPGSALACLDAVASVAVEAACEKALFAGPEAVAAALAYVNAQVSLLTASVALAERDPAYQPAVERLRRGIEEDRFGLVAQVLSTRGCAAPDCPDLVLVRDKKRILANMTGHAFATSVEAHARAWHPGGGAALAAVASTPFAIPGSSGAGADAGTAMASTTPGGRRKYELPSSETIPPVSIMDAESDVPPGIAEKRAAAARARREKPAAAHPAPAANPPQQHQPQPQAQTSGSR